MCSLLFSNPNQSYMQKDKFQNNKDELINQI